MRSLACLSGLLLATGCAWKLGPPDVSYGEVTTPVPLVRPSTDPKRWYVPVDSDTLGPQVWFLDTGYSYTTCDDDLVAGLELQTRRAAPVRGELGRVSTRKAQLPALELGGHTLEGLVCQVRDLGTTSSIDDPEEVAVAGVIGIDVLRRFRVELDPGRGEVRLLDPDAVEPLPRTGRGISPLRRERRLGIRTVMPLEVDGARTWTVLDTGATNTYIDGDRLGLEPSYELEGVTVRGTGAGATEVRTLSYIEVPGAEVGGVATRRVVLTHRDRDWFTPGLLGLDLVERFRMELDFRRRRARLTRISPAELPQWAEWYPSGSRLPTGRLRDDVEGVVSP